MHTMSSTSIAPNSLEELKDLLKDDLKVKVAGTSAYQTHSDTLLMGSY